jgi:hypothetical protein
LNIDDIRGDDFLLSSFGLFKTKSREIHDDSSVTGGVGGDHL